MPQENGRLARVLARLEGLPDLEQGRRRREAFGLEGIEGLLTALGRPQEGLPVIHIAGSKGKGTTALYLVDLLEGAGHRTGAFLSPHLHSLRERFLLGGRPAAAGRIANHLEKAAAAAGGAPGCTLFDLYTAAAMGLFRTEACNAVVLECGLGGRLDSTNLAEPLVTVVTTVEREHEEVLGRGVARVAAEKGGIIKPGVPLVTGCRGEALRVVRDIARKTGAPCHILGTDYPMRICGRGSEGYTVEWEKKETIDTAIKVPAQVRSLALAGAAFTLFCGRPVTAAELSRASRRLLPGRFEYLPGDPAILVDVAHTPRSLAGLARAFRTWHPGQRPILLFGTARDKRWRRPLSLLSALAAETWLVTLPGDRGVPPGELAEAAVGRVRRLPSIDAGLADLCRLRGRDKLVLVTGSHLLVGPVRVARFAERKGPHGQR